MPEHGGCNVVKRAAPNASKIQVMVAPCNPNDVGKFKARPARDGQAARPAHRLKSVINSLVGISLRGQSGNSPPRLRQYSDRDAEYLVEIAIL